MVFTVKRELTLPVCRVGGARRHCCRAAPQVYDRRIRAEIDPSAVCTNSGTEIDVLAVHEISLVEEPGGLGVGPPHEQAGSADPVDFGLVGGHLCKAPLAGTQ